MAPEFFFYYAVDSEIRISAWYADTCPDVTCLSAVPSVLYAVCTYCPPHSVVLVPVNALVVFVTLGNFARNAEREPVTVPGELPEPAL